MSQTTAAPSPDNSGRQPDKAPPINTLSHLLEKSKGQIALALPKHLTPERMIRVATTTFLRTPQLQKCSPLSIVACVVQASELGLELSGPLGHAYMVPYWNKDTRCLEAQFQIGYRGLIELAYRSGKVVTFTSRVVYANDRFKVFYGTNHEIHHEPTLDEPGEPIAFYAIVKTIDGGLDFEVMSKSQVDKHRAKHSKQKEDGAFNPWNTAYEEMAKKTPLRRLAKRVPLSIELVQAAAIDEYNEVAAVSAETAALISGPPTGQFSINGGAKENATPPEVNGTPVEESPKEETKQETAPAIKEESKKARKPTIDAIRKEEFSKGIDITPYLKDYGRAKIEDLNQQQADELLATLRGLESRAQESSPAIGREF